VPDAIRIAAIRHRIGKPPAHAELALRLSQQQQARIGRLVAAIKIDCEFLAANGWQVEGEQRIVGHGGCGARLIREATCRNNDLLRESLASRHSRRRFPHASCIIRASLPDGLQAARNKILSWCVLIFALLWTLGTLVVSVAEYRYVMNALYDGRYRIIEGPVTDFVPMPYEGHLQESFVVGGHRFSYSDYIVTAGFHNTASHGGPIREGLYVRVSYLDNLILRLEVAE
jgi:hypothetical protein